MTGAGKGSAPVIFLADRNYGDFDGFIRDLAPLPFPLFTLLRSRRLSSIHSFQNFTSIGRIVRFLFVSPPFGAGIANIKGVNVSCNRGSL
jgi:hypothetical protein